MKYLMAEQIQAIVESFVDDIKPKYTEIFSEIGIHKNDISKVIVELIKQNTKNITFDGIVVKEEECIRSYLSIVKNALLVNDIKKAQDRAKELFPGSRLSLELRSNDESGKEVLFFLIQSTSDLDDDLASLHLLDEDVPSSENFIVDLDFS